MSFGRTKAGRSRTRIQDPPLKAENLPDAAMRDASQSPSPLPGDGKEMHAAVIGSIEELAPWMAWPKEHRTVDDSEASSRRARVAFLERSELRLHLYLKGTDTLVGSSGLQRIDWEVPKFERAKILGRLVQG
jgi:hypothetical protein